MTWEEVLLPIQSTAQYQQLWNAVEQEYTTTICYPPKEQIFRALDLTPFEEVKVVIIGQDPYHNEGQANGLSFSVSNGVKSPPSLRNIFIELQNDLGVIRISNELEDWAKQGVLMLNATLTVRAHQPNSHKDMGWEYFTDAIIQAISDFHENVVFVLWGAFAHKKAALIDEEKHFVLKTPHPSPFSARKGFFGSNPFSRINEYLQKVGKLPIEW